MPVSLRDKTNQNKYKLHANYDHDDARLAAINKYYGFGEQKDVYGIEPHYFIPTPGCMFDGMDLSDPLFDVDEAKCMLMDHNRYTEVFSEPESYIEELVWYMAQPENFAFTCKVLFNIELAPFQLFTLQELWRRQFPMLLATRGGGKTWILSLYAMLRAVFAQGSKVVVVGAAFRQSKLLFEYMEGFWKNAPILRGLVGVGKGQGPKRDVDRCNFYIGDSEIIAIPLGDGCLCGKTMTMGFDGFSTMNQPHGLIWGSETWEFSDEHYANGLQDTKIVRTSKGFQYEGTYNHKMKVLRNGAIEWVRTDEIMVGDRILINRCERWHEGEFECSTNDAYLLGSLIGDGCWTDKYYLDFATNDHDHFGPLLKEMDDKWYQTGDSHWELDGKDKHSAWIEFWGLQDICYAQDKKLPQSILSAKQDSMVSCLQGLFDTDGHIQIQTDNGGTAITVGFTNTSKRLVEQIQFILLHFGIVSCVSSRDRNENWNTIYELLMTGRDAVLFAEKIGFRMSRKQDVLMAAIRNKSRFVSCGDEIPGVRIEMMRIARENRVQKGQNNQSLNHVCASKIASRKSITHEYARDFLKKYMFVDDPFIDTLRVLANPSIYYDEVLSIEDSCCFTYDIHVPKTHEYCAGGFFSHNTKIRGLRANYTIADEFASIPLEIFEIVIKGFASVSAAPVKRAENISLIKQMRELGWDEEAEAEEEALGFGNQTIVSGTAYYSFNHFYDYWKRYKEIIESCGDERRLEEIFNGEIPKHFDWTQFSIIRAPYQCLPDGFMDRAQISQARATIHKSIYLMEYGACFADDSDGFFRRRLIETCVTNKPVMTPKSGPVQFACSIYGDRQKQYVYGIDPASEQDNFAIIVLEIYEDHRRIVYSWTITRQEMRQRVQNQGNVEDRSFYVFCARKIRDLMKVFPTEHIVIDSQGGGHTIAETLRDVKECEENEMPLLPYIKSGDDDVFWWEEDNKPTDKEAGNHILHIVNFANAKFIYEANHGMRKDMESKQLLFPYFDPITLANSVALDSQLGRSYDTLEDAMMELESLKDELSTIVHDQTSGGRDRWDTPEVKLPGGKKGRLRKDRYSALLIGNMVARCMLNPSLKPEYEAKGGFAGQQKRSGSPDNGQLYTGPSNIVTKMTGVYGKGVYRRNGV